MNKEEIKFNLDEDVLYQIAMEVYDECNDKIATINDHLGEVYGYSDLRDAKEYELKYEKDLLEIAVKQLQEENKTLKQPTLFIDTQDMEERYGEQLYQDYLVEQNKDLQQRISKAIEYINKGRCGDYCDDLSAEDLIEILGGKE